jgi:hypothetical protein
VPDAKRKPNRRRLRLFLVVADAPAARYGAQAINEGLSDLSWVSRAAVAHESVVEAFRSAPALLPMKLFTIFTSDARAIEHVVTDRERIDAVLRRVVEHDEWGLRVFLDPAAAVAAGSGARAVASGGGSQTGLAYLNRKKTQRETARVLAADAQQVVRALYARISTKATMDVQRPSSEIGIGGSMVLDVALLVRRSHARAFRASIAREMRALAPKGYRLMVTGPWPPYSFLET